MVGYGKPLFRLPLFYEMKDKEVEYVVEMVEEFYR